MPVLTGAVTLARLRADPAKRPEPRRWLLRGLARKAFQPLDPRRGEEDRSAGFVELEDHDATAFGTSVFQGAYALFAWRVDAVKIPGAEVKAELQRWAAAFAAEQGRPPGRAEKARRKQEVRHDLRRRATPASRVFDVSWNLDTGEVSVWAGSRKVVDEVAAALEEACGVNLAPTSASAAAARAGVPEGALSPTPSLVGDLAGARAEVDHGEA